MRQRIARFLPYTVKVQLHRLCNFLRYHAVTWLGRDESLLPPKWLSSVGGGDYYKSGERFFQHFVDIAGLQPHERVLDVGCGTGRMARPLTAYLKSGSYDGIDIVSPSIKWCQKTYIPRYPNFHFHFTDIYNKMYNPTGRYQASSYRFPFENSSFDFVFLTSVFTHMLPRDMENYFSEITRVLKPGGRCLITYFLLTPDSLERMEGEESSIAFRYELQGCRVENTDVPEDAIAYYEGSIRELYRKCHMHISEPIYYGKWFGNKNGLSYQDIVVANKPF